MFLTADQILCHLVGDYCLQSHWMATEKTKKSLPAALHAIFYTLPFLFLTLDPRALAAIVVTHFVIDRWRLVRHLIWLKNFLALPSWRAIQPRPPGPHTPKGVFSSPNSSWSECSNTGYPDTTPPWLAVWLMIITDNIMHLACNATVLWLSGVYHL